jgi:hypothetical protein
MKKGKRKNPHAVVLGRLGRLVQSEAKKRANKENGRKGGLVKSRKKTAAAQRNARRPRPGRRKKPSISCSNSSVRVMGRWQLDGAMAVSAIVLSAISA